jgi:predicted DNA-binding ribbon-helix-helix protein
MFSRHSIRIGGRSVSISLEQEFWDCLRDIAADRNTTLSHLITEVAGEMNDGADGRALASMLRVYVLEEVIREADSAATPGERGQGRLGTRSTS